jgi:hypothetical protein
MSNSLFGKILLLCICMYAICADAIYTLTQIFFSYNMSGADIYSLYFIIKNVCVFYVITKASKIWVTCTPIVFMYMGVYIVSFFFDLKQHVIEIDRFVFNWNYYNHFGLKDLLLALLPFYIRQACFIYMLVLRWGQVEL